MEGVIPRRGILGSVNRHRPELKRDGLLTAIQRERDVMPKEQVLLRFLLRITRGGKAVRNSLFVLLRHPSDFFLTILTG